MKTKYKVGDRVKVIRGPISFFTNDEGKFDMREWTEDESIGKVGIITDAHKIQDIDNYSLHYPCGFGGKVAWFNNKDLNYDT